MSAKTKWIWGHHNSQKQPLNLQHRIALGPEEHSLSSMPRLPLWSITAEVSSENLVRREG
ncbi:hypothetical protein [Porphyromonas sp. COT-290 OH3588]|uniref:hypothetical protein n=1 Tax=Porphyromonas sp. COT-290 OH3588 TaxID=1515617 RepID=UPI000AD9C477|nr:hypothetical protein [Porphyromonas sp. COT-290 OH3588]